LQVQAKNETQLTAGQASKTSRVALITGITGQDGGYLAELLLRKGYRVHGFAREATVPLRLQHAGLADDPRLTITSLDMRDDRGLEELLADCQPDEIYNLAAQSHIHTSFERPDETSDINATATMRLLKLVVRLGLVEKSRIYQASTSEIFGDSQLPRFDETAPFHPMSPYAVSKLAAFEAAMNYREAYNVHVSNGILFNHESPYRGENFVTRKITQSVAQLACDTKGAWSPLHLGNLDASRDWGHARDYVDAMWRMLQQDTPGDYVIATGSVHSVRQLVEAAFGHIDRTLVVLTRNFSGQQKFYARAVMRVKRKMFWDGLRRPDLMNWFLIWFEETLRCYSKPPRKIIQSLLLCSLLRAKDAGALDGWASN
jgi:GDPmannose 4,6-dehydratase